MDRPVLISITAFCCGGMAIILPIVILIDLLDGEDFNSYVHNNGQILSNSITTAVYWVFCCTLSWGFLKRLFWIRYLVVLMYVIATLYWLIFNPFSGEFVSGFFGVFLSYWYLFKKPNVVKYFESNYNKALNEDANNSSAY